MSVNTVDLQNNVARFTEVISAMKRSCASIRNAVTLVDTGILNKQLVDEIISGIDLDSKIVKSDRDHRGKIDITT